MQQQLGKGSPPPTVGSAQCIKVGTGGLGRGHNIVTWYFSFSLVLSAYSGVFRTET